jgi:23S rRNA G2445 N2-methylase RlmL
VTGAMFRVHSRGACRYKLPVPAPRDEAFEQKLRDPGFTPGVRALPALAAYLTHDDPVLAKAAARGVARIDSPVNARVERLLPSLAPAEQKALLRALSARSLTGADEALPATVARLLDAADEPVRVAAARTLARWASPLARSAIETALAAAKSPREREALETALVSSGGEPTATSGASPAVDKARLIAERDARRTQGSESVSLEARLPPRSAIFLSCRRGLEEVLQAELVELLGAPATHATVSAGRIALSWSGPLSILAASRVALAFGLCFQAPRDPSESAASAVTALLASADVTRTLGSLLPGPATFRLAWADGGKRRSETWQVAREMRARAPSLINDPSDSSWHVEARVTEREVALDVVPRCIDERFAYRRGDVPAASHPTIAAALARVAGVRDDDVVWDPFVGSGLELCERARLGPYRALYGSDLDENAIRIARANLTAVGAERAQLSREDARGARIPELSCVISNPPMGRRVMRGEDVAATLGDVIRAAGHTLVPGGRIVLLSPHPMSTDRVARSIGLEKTIDRRVDLGGFDAVLQRFERRRQR